jgi:peptidoglycan/LPS O-acetylase OafA/YrhL
MVWIGRIVHLYVALASRRVCEQRPHGRLGRVIDAARLALTFGLATASFYLIELPIRERRRLDAFSRACLTTPRSLRS